MLRQLNSAIRTRAPSIHRLVRDCCYRAELPIPRLIAGRLLFLHPRILLDEPTEPHIIRWIRARLKPGDTFFDIGAHHGWMSFCASGQVGPTGSVVAFEPAPVLAELLAYHKRLNRIAQLEVIPKAVSCRDDCEVPFYAVRGGDSFLNALAFEPAHLDSEPRSVIRVDTLTLDSFCNDHGCRATLVKIDVEGAELLVLQGAQTLLAEHRPALIVAVHPPWLPQGQKADDVFHMLSSCGYQAIDSSVVRYEGADFGDYLFVIR